MEKERIIVEVTKKGYPALWENGGGYTNTGESTIIADSNGKPKKPVYIRRRGHLANSDHALIIVEVGDYIVQANHHRKDFGINIYKIVNFETESISRTYPDTSGDTEPIRMTGEELRQQYGKTFEELPETEIDGMITPLYRRVGNQIITKSLGVYEVWPVSTKTTVYHYAIAEEVTEFSCGEWETDPPAFLHAAIEAAKEKATCYHCREPHFIKEEDKE